MTRAGQGCVHPHAGNETKAKPGKSSQSTTILRRMQLRAPERLRAMPTRALTLAAALLCTASGHLAAQTSASRPVPPPVVPPGSVTGHITCSDTNGPARFASVTLQPVVPPKSTTRRDTPGSTGPREVNRLVQTSLDGSFTIPAVPPGNYYVLADAPGYLSPTGVLTREQMEHPTEAQARIMAQMVAPVSVASNRASTAEVRLQRGATLAGTVRFDDGTPFAGAYLRLWRKQDDGKWGSFRAHILGSRDNTDDVGQFRLSGLPAGEYRISTTLELEEVYTDAIFGDNQSFSINSSFDLTLYSPGTTRTKDAQTVKLADGQTDSSISIEVPLSKLHTISRSLVEEGTGRRINAGSIKLLYADDDTQLASLQVNSEDGSFHLPFVPEGSYVVKVSDAKEVARTVFAEPDNLPPTRTETKVIRSYGDASQPLVVTTDMQGVLVSVPAAKPATGTATTP